MHSKRERDTVRCMLRWYKKNKRDLPWRNTRNPYRILISEVMLQQTQVDRVIPKYKEFLRAFPSAKQLANAKTADVIKAWRGLGYNRRALFLRHAAGRVVREYGGRFPKDLHELKTLPGVGDYTARAILSFAFDAPVPMMDTNHRRFYQRIFFGHKKVDDRVLLQKAEEIIPKKLAYDWNQALMDFGSLALCSNTREYCLYEPIRELCKACREPDTKKTRQKNTKQKKKTIPFRETDRYYRGRIIDELREKDRIARLLLRKKFDDISDERFERIVRRLEKDGLILQEKKSIVFP
jgi:A/G-specific adenine glycosylase